MNRLSKKGSKRTAPVQDSLALGYEVLEVREDGDEGEHRSQFNWNRIRYVRGS